MQEFHRRVTAVTPVPHAEETSAALLTGATVIPLADSGDFTDAGGHVRILGTVYEFIDMDEGDVSGVPSITLTTGLVADVPAETMVEEWNNARSEVVTDWVATVTDEVDGSSNEAILSHAMIALIATGIPVVGESVVVTVDDEGTWWVTNVIGATPGYDPGFIRTGGLGADTVVWAGTENGRRAQLDGIDGALEAFNDANEQTVNLDGETNYIEGTLATAASGPRVEIGPGELGGDPTDETRYRTDHADELVPGKVRSRTVSVDIGVDAGVVEVVAADWDGDAGDPPKLNLTTGSTLSSSAATLSATTIALVGDTTATMAGGSVGSGAFKTSVQDAAVAAPFSTSLGHIERAADATQALATSAATTTTILFQSSVAAARGGISYNAGTGQFTVTNPGRYHINAVVSFSANTAGRRLLQIVRNGTTRKSTNDDPPSAGNSAKELTGTFDCVASDVIEIKALQDSGATLTVQGATNVTITNLGA